MSPKKITRPVDIYVRVSRVGGREGDSFISPELQEERCRALAKARGLEVGEVLTDLDKSGGKMDRPALEAALARIEAGASGGLVVARLDRFARTLVGGLNTLKEIDEAGGVVLTAEGDFDTSTATGELVLNMMLTLGAFELRRIRESWDAARGKAVERGVHGGSRVPLGYTRVEDGRLHVDPETAPHVREAFMLRARSESWRTIYEHLAEHCPGRLSSLKAAAKLVSNRVYLGEARSGDHVREGAHEPLVTEAVYLAANRTAGNGDGSRRAAWSKGEGALLSGLLRCAGCGGRMTGTYTTRNGKKYEFYRCQANLDCETKTTIGARIIEPFVEEYVLAHVRKRATIGGRDVPNVKGLQAELAEAARQLDAWDEAFDADTDPEAFRRGRARRKKRVEEAQAKLAEARSIEAGQESSLRTLTLWVQAPEGAEAVYRASSVTDRRKMLAAMLTAPVTVAKGRGPIEERVSIAA